MPCFLRRDGITPTHSQVWSLATLSSQSSRLLSAAADGTVRVWDTATRSPLQATLLPPQPTHDVVQRRKPGATFVAACPLDATRCVAAYTNGDVWQFDVESCQAYLVAAGGTGVCSGASPLMG